VTLVNRMVDTHPCNVIDMLRRVRNRRTIIIIINCLLMPQRSYGLVMYDVSTPFTDYGQIWYTEADPKYTLNCVALERRKAPKFYHIFNFCILLWSHLVA